MLNHLLQTQYIQVTEGAVKRWCSGFVDSEHHHYNGIGQYQYYPNTPKNSKVWKNQTRRIDHASL